MKRLLSICSSVFLLAFASELLAKERPNFLLILLDDSGWTDLGCYGSNIQTPHIDGLAREGMRFSDCHSAAPNCSPSRAGLLTGRIPPRLGIYSYIPENHVMHLRDEEITLAELLRSDGYTTGHFGKWHLSRLQSDQPGPQEQGFDYSLGTNNNAKPSHHNPSNFIRNGKALGRIEGYSCQIVVNETIKWLDETKAADDKQPFFACVWFHEPHTPIASPPELTKKYQRLFPELSKKEATYHANVENVDRAVGRLLNQLKERQLEEDTVVFLTSDNGPLNRFSRQGLRGQKSNVWEGGHRVPGIVRWPDHVQAGSECQTPISGVDYLPTVCDIAGIAPPADRILDGQSIRPLLLGKESSFERRKPLYWFFYRLTPAIAIRDGQWSLIADTTDSHRPKAHPLLREDIPAIRSSTPNDFRLFNLDSDLRQQTDQSENHKEKFEQLKSKLRQLHEEVVQEGYQWEIPQEFGLKNKRRLWPSE